MQALFRPFARRALQSVERAATPSFAPLDAWLATSGALLSRLAATAAVCCALGFCLGFADLPLDVRQGDVHRIVFIHVPATWVSLLLYLAMASFAAVGIWRREGVAPMLVEAIAPTGLLFTFLALWTGALWGKPVWGAWWVWDARLAADVALLAFYLAVVALHFALEDSHRADRLAAPVALGGLVVVAFLLASVALVPAVHDNPEVRVAAGGHRRVALVAVLGIVALGLLAYAGAVVLARLRCVILERARERAWAARRARAKA